MLKRKSTFLKAKVYWYKSNPDKDKIHDALSWADVFTFGSDVKTDNSDIVVWELCVWYDNPHFKEICKALSLVDMLNGDSSAYGKISKIFKYLDCYYKWNL